MPSTNLATSPTRDIPLTDNGLTEAIANADQDALEHAFHIHGNAVKGTAVRVLRDDDLAEDVVQDVFVQLWNSPEKFDASRGTLRTYLSTIAHRRAVDVVRSETARHRREQREPLPISYDIEDDVWSRDLSSKVRSALDSLPSREREAIALAYFGGHSYAEVAKRLGAPEGTVKSRIRSGMRTLSSSLGELAT